MGLAEVYGGGQGGERPHVNAGLVLVAAAATAVRRRFPTPCLLVFAALALVVQVPATGLALTAAVFVGSLVALGTVSRYRPLREALTGLVVTLAAMVVGAVAASRTWDVLIVLLGCGAAWIMGRLLQREALRNSGLTALASELAEEGDARATEAVQTERMRIARELHDAVAHSVSIMTLQVGGVRRSLDADPSRRDERDVLLDVEALGREAVAELHRVVGVLRAADRNGATEGLAPQPRLADVADLVARVRSAGMAVHLVVEGSPCPLPPGLDQTAYRIVQEAVTNVLKHAPGAGTVVRVAYGAAELDLVVEDEGGAHSAEGGLGAVPGGHGLAGMRERAAVYGGRVDAGPRPGRGFRVEACLPLPEPTR